MHKTLTSVLALAGLAVAGAAQAEDAVIAGDADEPILLTSTQLDSVTAGTAGGSWSSQGDATVFVFGFSRNIPGVYANANITTTTNCYSGTCTTFSSAFGVVDGY